MNKSVLTFLFLFFILVRSGFSDIWIVCNQYSEGSHYSSIQSAIEHAQAHDTIYVKGSKMNYGSVLLEKPLTLIAEGSLNDELPANSVKLTRLLLTHNPYLKTVSSGSSIIGFEFPYFSGNKPNIISIPNPRVRIENITIERNWVWFIEIPSAARNWTFRNNIIRGWVNGGSETSLRHGGFELFHFHNNIINTIKGFENSEVYIYNNVITGRLKNISGAKVYNNIFSRETYVLENVSGCHFRGNVTVSEKLANDECYSQPERFEGMNKCTGEYNTGSGNLVGVDPGFAYWPSTDVMGGSVFKLNNGSPAKSAGIKGQEPGIYGGDFPFPENYFKNQEMYDPFPAFITSVY